MTMKIEPDRTWCPDIQITDDDWRAISEESALPLDKLDKERIYALVNEYYSAYCFSEHGVRANQFDSKIDEVIDGAEKLFSALAQYDAQDVSGGADLCDDLDFEQLLGGLVRSGKIGRENVAVISRIATESENFHGGFPYGYQFISELRAHLYALIKTCEACKEYEEISSIGASGDAHLTEMILGLKRIFEDKTGESEMTKCFVGLVLGVAGVIKRQSLADFGASLNSHVMRLTPSRIKQRVRDARKGGVATPDGQD